MKLHFLTSEEESAIKRSIPWESIDVKARELVLLANEVKGIATLQSCAGHVKPGLDIPWKISAAFIAFRVTKKRMEQILYGLCPELGIWDVNIRYFEDGTFWICIEVDPAHRQRLADFFSKLAKL